MGRNRIEVAPETASTHVASPPGSPVAPADGLKSPEEGAFGPGIGNRDAEAPRRGQGVDVTSTPPLLVDAQAPPTGARNTNCARARIGMRIFVNRRLSGSDMWRDPDAPITTLTSIAPSDKAAAPESSTRPDAAPDAVNAPVAGTRVRRTVSTSAPPRATP